MIWKNSALLWLMAAVLTCSAALTGCGRDNNQVSEPFLRADVQQTNPGGEEMEITEDPGIPLTTKYIVLSYPAELENMVSVRYEDIQDGQEIIFTTNFTGEELELFRFSLSKSGTDGYELGVLNDENAGELRVCVDVKDYENGSWTPEEYAKLNSLQERVNDIIIQFHEDPRFVPAR